VKILFFISSLRAGGAERVASLLCNHWSKVENLEVSLLTYDAPQNDFYVVNESVKRYWTGIFRSNDDNGGQSNILKRVYLNFIRILRIRKVLVSVRPDVMVSFMDAQNIVALVACLFTGIPVVISERTYPQYFNEGNLFDWLRKIIYKLSSAFVAQTNTVAVWAQKFLCNTKIAIIPNPLDVVKILQNDKSSIRQNYILYVGRLSSQKGPDLLIEAYSKCYKDYPQWRLLLVGDGEERKKLEEQIARLGLGEYVVLTGRTSNPEMYYKSAKIFVLSSRVEGFPNALLEAMAYGLPVISFDCEAGPSDIIKSGENGLLVPAGDISALSEAMKKLMDDEVLRDKLSNEALKVVDRYSVELISKQWICLLRERLFIK